MWNADARAVTGRLGGTGVNGSVMDEVSELDDLRELSTESRRDGLEDLDLRSTRELVALMNAEDATVAEAVAAAGDALAAVADAAAEALGAGGRLIYVGAGTSGRLALVDAVECVPTFGLDPGQIIALVAGGPLALDTSLEDAEDDESAGVADVERVGAGPRDLVVGISASGGTPYVLGAVRAAAAAGAVTGGIACNAGAALTATADLGVEIVVGPELLAGSTRLKAGTAQKLALNTISTVAMIRLGRVHGNLMVEFLATNAKLHARARRIVAEATGAGPREAQSALDAADGEVKTAIVLLLAGVDAAAARARLAAAEGAIRRAVAVDRLS